MKDVTFYQEFHNRSKTKATGNVLAVFRNARHGGMFDAIGAIFDQPNSSVGSISVSSESLYLVCKRISEAKARQIHPNLFKFLELWGRES